jgi:hypothetical protein
MAYDLSSKINADNLLIDPIQLLADSRKSEALDTSSSFSKPTFTTARKAYNKKDDFGLGDFASASDIMQTKGKTALYGDKFNEIGDVVNTINMMNEADTGVYIAQAKKNQLDAMMAKQRAACKSSKKKGLFGSLITGGIGLATGNPALIASGAAGALGSTGGC